MELGWIEEKLHPLRAAETAGSLPEALNARKKHDQLDAEVSAHQPRVDATIRTGEELVAQKHAAATDIAAKCDMLRAAWRSLHEHVDRSCALLDWTVERERLYADAVEIEAWTSEKQQQVRLPLAHFANLIT